MKPVLGQRGKKGRTRGQQVGVAALVVVTRQTATPTASQPVLMANSPLSFFGCDCLRGLRSGAHEASTEILPSTPTAAPPPPRPPPIIHASTAGQGMAFASPTLPLPPLTRTA